MVRKCCVPGCKSNYASTLKKKGFYVSCFGFPRNEELKHSWLEAIPRKNYIPSIYSGVCEFHFDKDDILRYDKFLRPDGTIQDLLLRYPRLKKNTVPKFFQHNMKHEEIGNNQYPHVEEEVNIPAFDVPYEEDGVNCESKEVMFRYVGTNKNIIKEELIDDSNESLDEIENDGLYYPSKKKDEIELSSMFKMEGSHTEKNGHNCVICGESFNDALDLRVHVEVHVRGFEYRCMVCGEAFIDEQACALHVQEHKEEVFYCSKCSEAFPNKTELVDHLSTHETKAFSRKLSGSELAPKKKPKRHKLGHKKSKEQYPCCICEKTFSSKSSQQIHIRKHTGDRPFACSFCHKAFCDSGSRRKHERIHTGEKPYVCVVCQTAFNQRVCLRNHIKSIHSAPHPKSKHNRTPYHCSICTDRFVTSQELIEHLINHCDMKTALKLSSETSQRKFKSRTGLKLRGTDELE